MSALPPGLAIRDAIHDHDHVPSHLVVQGRDERAPFITLAIPTFRRPDLLKEAVESILAQDFDRPIEIIVVDNDPESTGGEDLMAAVPALADAAFRYYVNAENIGMYPNHNRCFALARGEWMSILNDDDLLRPDCFSTLFRTIDAHPEIQAIGCRKLRTDEREVKAARPPARWRLAAYAAATELEYKGRPWRRIRPDKFFWGTMMDNMAGFVCKREPILALGGFPAEEEWSSDTWFYIRVAASIGLYQHRERLAIVRVRRNESMRPEVLRSFLRQGTRIRRTLVDTVAPRWWRRFEGLALAEERGTTIRYWGVDLPADEVAREVGMPVVPERPFVFRWAKLLLGGF